MCRPAYAQLERTVELPAGAFEPVDETLSGFQRCHDASGALIRNGVIALIMTISTRLNRSLTVCLCELGGQASGRVDWTDKSRVVGSGNRKSGRSTGDHRYQRSGRLVARRRRAMVKDAVHVHACLVKGVRALARLLLTVSCVLLPALVWHTGTSVIYRFTRFSFTPFEA